jgi:hypothetical protein
LHSEVQIVCRIWSTVLDIRAVSLAKDGAFQWFLSILISSSIIAGAGVPGLWLH